MVERRRKKIQRDIPMKLSVIIPAYNEEECIIQTLAALQAALPKQDVEILVCNDHSTDATAELALHHCKKDSRIRVLTNTENKGFGNVLRFGFSQAKGKFVIPVMADLCDEVSIIPRMLEMATEGYDVVVGSRYIRGGAKKNVQNKFKSFLSWGVGLLGWYLLRLGTHDCTNAFKLMKRDAVRKVKTTGVSFDVSPELTIKLKKLGCKITEIPTIWIDRSAGDSKFFVGRVGKKYILQLLYALSIRRKSY
ncbi:glycosyltransferase [Candidatus Dojkabacteria bacterium]|nr:glycosyltransferase [Candidatus Dojkabacteria bacterium]